MTDEKFTPEELHLIVNTISRNSLSPELKEKVAKSLVDKKKRGIKINDFTIAESIEESVVRATDDGYFHNISVNHKTVEYK